MSDTHNPTGPDTRQASGCDISVIITTCNRSDRLAITLDSLATQSLPRTRWELIVVDNASRDDTATVLAQAPAGLPLRVIHHEIPGKCGAQNRALQQARGALLVFTDDDVQCPPHWLETFAAAAERWPDADLFGGAIVIEQAGSVPAWLATTEGRAIIERHYAAYTPRVDEGATNVPPIGPNMAIRRSALGANRFDERVGPDGSRDYIKGGDTDINRALMDEGRLCVYVPTAELRHRVFPDQLTQEALFAGVYRRGRKNGYLWPRTGRIAIGGVPLRLWLALARQWLRFKLAGNDPRQRFRLGEKYHFRRGMLAQMRAQRQ